MNWIIEFWKLCSTFQQCLIIALIGIFILYLQFRGYIPKDTEMYVSDKKDFDLPMFNMKRELRKKMERNHDTRRRNLKVIR